MLRAVLSNLLVFAALFTCANVGADAAVTTPEERKYEDLFNASRYDRILLGTSHAAHGVNPRILERHGIELYNFAYHGASPLFYRQWYKLYRRHHAPPRSVIFAVDWTIFKRVLGRHFEQDSEFLPWSEFGQLTLLDSEVAAGMMLQSRLPLIRARDRVQELMLFQKRESALKMERYYKGYVPVQIDHTPDNWVASLPNEPFYRARFLELLQQFKREGVRVTFIQTPEYLPNVGPRPAENAEIRRIADSMGIAFLNYNDEGRSALNQEASNFIDWGHMNDQGASAFSERLGRDLRARKLF